MKPNFGRPISDNAIANSAATLTPQSGSMKRMSMRVGKIKTINTKANTVNLEWLWPIAGGIDNVSLSRPYVGLRSGIHFMPEVGSIVVVGYAFNIPVLLSYLLPGDYSAMINGVPDNTGNPSQIDQINAGEILLKSVQGSEVYLQDKITITDSGLDSITLDPSSNLITIDALNVDVLNEAGELFMGMVIRQINGVNTVITSDGQPVISAVGGNALTELSISIDSVAGSTINDGSTNPSLANITVGTLVNNGGKKVLNQLGNQIVCNISFSSGALVQIDSAGNVNINGGNMSTPTSVPFVNTNTGTSIQVTPTFLSPMSQQRSAREGDRVVIPMTTPTTSAQLHPDLVNKATFNIEQLQQIASMIMTPYGPCTGFIPSTPDTRLVGEITQGSDTFFVGSLNKQAEQQETNNNSL